MYEDNPGFARDYHGGYILKSVTRSHDLEEGYSLEIEKRPVQEVNHGRQKEGRSGRIFL
jgi:hypothetical protein